MLRVHLLGRPHMTLDGAECALSARPKVLPLLALLLLNGNVPLERARAAGELWPDEPDADARANLRRHVHYLAALLPPAVEKPWLLIDAKTIAWNSEADFEFDVAEFRALATDSGRLEEAVTLYAGDLLEEMDEPWLAEPRRELGIRYATCLLELVATHRARRSFARAESYARALLAYDSWREDAVRQLLVIRYETGDRAGAIAEFRRFEHALRKEMGVEPMPETVAVYRSIESGIAPTGSAAPESGLSATGAEPALAGRRVELQRIVACWNAAAGGEGHAVFLTGAAGIGKSRLVRECAAFAELAGGTAAFGTTGAREPAPYHAVADLVRSLASLAPALAIDPVWLAAAASLAPTLKSQAGLPELATLDPQRERARLFEAIAMLVEACAALRPVCAIVEDLHWAGTATLDLCTYLVRRLRASRVLWLLTWREDDAPENAALHELRLALDGDRAAVHVPLGPLRLLDTAALLRDLTPLEEFRDADAVERLHGLCGGNPFYISQFALDPASLDGTQTLPATLRGSIAARTATLGERARAFLAAAAIAGTTFDPAVVAETTGWFEVETDEALAELLRRRFVRERVGVSEFEFSHHLVQSTIYEATDPEIRQLRHRRLAGSLNRIRGERPEFAGEIARHYDLGGAAEPAATAYARAAAFALSVYATVETVALARRALDLTIDHRVRFHALETMCAAAALGGDRATQAALGDELIATAARLGADERCRALRARIDAANVTSDHETERPLIDRLDREAASAGPHWRASALEARCKLLRSTGEFDAEQACFSELLALGPEVVDQGTFSEAYISHADTLIFRGRLAEARAILTDVRARIDARLNRTSLARTIAAFSRAALAQQDYAAMAEYSREAYDLSRSIGDLEGEALGLHNIANAMVYTPQVGEARGAYERAIAMYARLGHQIGLASANVDYGLYHNELGLLDDAASYYERALAIADAIDFRFVSCVGNVNLAYCERLRGRFAASKTAALRALAWATDLRSTHLEAAALGVLGAVERELGELDAALAHFERGVELRRAGPPSPRLGDNLCGLAATLRAAGRTPEAYATARELLEIHRENPRLAAQPTEWLWTCAQVARSAGDDALADELLRDAIAAIRARSESIENDRERTAFLDLPFNRALQTRC